MSAGESLMCECTFGLRQERFAPPPPTELLRYNFFYVEGVQL